MATRYYQDQTRSAPAARRQPLGPGDARANMHPPQNRVSAKIRTTATPPSHVKQQYHQQQQQQQPQQTPQQQTAATRQQQDDEAIHGSDRPTAPSGGNKRVSDIKKDSQRRSKRDSEISTASSTLSNGWRKRTIGQWQLGITVGTGGCSTVRLVRHVVTGQVGAVKIISRKMAEQVRAQSLANLAAAPDRSLQDLVAAGKAMPPPPPGLMREIAIMKLLDHPNIVRLYDVWENHNELYLVMEYVQGGELFHYVEECRGLDEKETVYIFRQIVAALLYCHRLHIHHRDLKPENILLDRENAQVKLVDFGMAALQPEGKQLTTACGSPHYAAPEVIRSRPYDGAKADVWSCGVILYVMLTGTTPFNYDHERNLAVMYHAISQADYYMPPELSFQAKDLLRKIFVTRPDKRISMDEIWEHPLLHKYDKEFRYEGELAKKDAWIGPMPKLDEYTVDREADIDKEIIRNMRTLWHSVPQAVLVKKLLSKEPNQEKYFYAALLKHREENLENYTGGSDGLSLAASDFQHAKPGDSAEALNPPHTKQASQSSYSIMNNEHLRSSSLAEAAAVDGTYDPYRPDRQALETSKSGQQIRTNTHKRANSNASHGSTLRVETLKKATRQGSQARSVHGRKQSPLPSAAQSRSASRASINRQSRQSLNSNHWPSSPPVAVQPRAAGSHKRNVSFNHVRRTSTLSALSTHATIPPGATATTQHYTPELKAKALQQQQEQLEEESVVMSSPSTRAAYDAGSRKAKMPTSTTPRGRSQRQPDTPGQTLKSEVRKVSTELEKACEEAFFRSSVGSSVRSSYTEKPSPTETPPSSVSTSYNKSSMRPPETVRRPLPAPPTETPNTFIARTLEEARSKLVARSAYEDNGDAAKIKAALASLDQIMPAAITELEKRVTSAPDPKSANDLGFLPIITEEPLPDSLRAGRDNPLANVHRSFTAPVHTRESLAQGNMDTIRMVEPSPQAHRQQLGDPYANEIQRPKTADGSIGSTKYLDIPGQRETLLRKKSYDSGIGFKMNGDDSTMSMPEPALAKKKSAWFRRRKDVSQPASIPEHQFPPHPGTLVELAELDDQQIIPASALKRDKQAPQPIKIDASRPPLMSPSSDPIIKKREEGESKISKWFSKLKSKEDELRATESKDGTSPTTSPTEQQQLSPSPVTPVAPATPAQSQEATRSWFSRFLRIRPESKVLCFAVARGRARSETYKILRDWQRHGIADLCYFPQENAITARVDKINALGIKPVAFKIELFVVLQNGKKVGLSLARWTQTRGAASSFRRVLEVIEETLNDRHMLIVEHEKRLELESILA